MAHLEYGCWRSTSVNFFTAEFPESVCTDWNDYFVALVDSASEENPADKNIAVVSVNPSKRKTGGGRKRDKKQDAIDKLVEGVESGIAFQTLLGVTGSGKTFTMAKVVERTNRPTLVLSHNKTLAAQLYQEFKQYFPENAVEYFVSYYDYYQPEAYLPKTDTYIEKDSSINEKIEGLRLSATRSLLTRRDVIVVASVSCIYGLGSPENYGDMSVTLACGEVRERGRLLRELASMQYTRSLYESDGGAFRVRGDVVEVFPTYQDEGIRIEFFDDEVDRITLFDPVTGHKLKGLDDVKLFPSSHYATPRERMEEALVRIREEMDVRVKEYHEAGRLLEAQRISQRTTYDMEMIREVGHCKGIENYSRHIEGRSAGEPPFTLMDYFPDDFLLIVDESHMTIPQVGGMYKGDRSRKEALVEFGFRLPSALDNRPLQFDEFERKIHQVLHVSATPGDYELDMAEGVTGEQVIRPTGLVDPEIQVRPAKTQVDDLLSEIGHRIAQQERVLVTTLTKRMAEDLTDYLREHGIAVRYLHSDIGTVERTEIIRDLRLGAFDVLVGINLLREGLDMPEVSLVAILDADKEGFLRSERSLIQTIGRAARNLRGTAILYADTVTGSMQRAIEETNRRREKQVSYNEEHDITPATIVKQVADVMESAYPAPKGSRRKAAEKKAIYEVMSPDQMMKKAAQLEKKMLRHARDLEFEEAAKLRDEIQLLRSHALGLPDTEAG